MTREGGQKVGAGGGESAATARPREREQPHLPSKHIGQPPTTTSDRLHHHGTHHSSVPAGKMALTTSPACCPPQSKHHPGALHHSASPSPDASTTFARSSPVILTSRVLSSPRSHHVPSAARYWFVRVLALACPLCGPRRVPESAILIPTSSTFLLSIQPSAACVRSVMESAPSVTRESCPFMLFPGPPYARGRRPVAHITSRPFHPQLRPTCDARPDV